MPARIVRLRTKADRLRARDAAGLRQLLLEYPGLPDRARGEVIAALDRQTASERGWTFVMLSPEQNAAVARWLHRHSRYPKLAPLLWAELFTALDPDTGEVMLTRDALAELVGAAPGDVSRVMGELSSVNAITVRRERVAGVRGPGFARYFMNPLVATNLAGSARDRAQAGAPALTVVGGGKG